MGFSVSGPLKQHLQKKLVVILIPVGFTKINGILDATVIEGAMPLVDFHDSAISQVFIHVFCNF